MISQPQNAEQDFVLHQLGAKIRLYAPIMPLPFIGRCVAREERCFILGVKLADLRPGSVSEDRSR